METIQINFDELKNNSAIRKGRYKLIQGHPGHPDGWYPPPSLAEILDATNTKCLKGGIGIEDDWESGT